MTAPLCFIDTETTGVHPEREIWEIGMIRRQPDGSEYEWSCFLPADLTRADPFGLNVGRYYERHPLGRELATHFTTTVPDGVEALTDPAPEPGAQAHYCLPALAVMQVLKFTHGAHLVGAVPSFDAISLDTLVRRHGGIPSWHYHLIDVENLAVGWLMNRLQSANYVWKVDGTTGRDVYTEEGLEALTPPWDSDELTRLLHLDPVPEIERHTALGDARWAKRIYDAVMVR